LRIAGEQVARLAELRAEDAATAVAHWLAGAGGLLSLGAGVPAAALRGGSGDAARVRRLIDGPTAISRSRAGSVVAATVAATLVPLVLLAVPVAFTWGMNYCSHRPAAAHAAAALSRS
jgi:hypothetical protein